MKRGESDGSLLSVNFCFSRLSERLEWNRPPTTSFRSFVPFSISHALLLSVIRYLTSLFPLKGKIKKEDQLHCSRWLVGDTSLQLTRWFLMINTPVWRRTRLENSNNKTVLIQVFNYKLWLLKGKVNWQQYHHDTMFLNIFYESQIFRLDKDNCLFPVMHPLKNLLKELKLVMKLKYNKATIWIL